MHSIQDPASDSGPSAAEPRWLAGAAHDLRACLHDERDGSFATAEGVIAGELPRQVRQCIAMLARRGPFDGGIVVPPSMTLRYQAQPLTISVSVAVKRAQLICWKLMQRLLEGAPTCNLETMLLVSGRRYTLSAG